MSESLQTVVRSLLAESRETEWLEFKLNDDREEEIGEYLSALSNAAALHERDVAYMVWGVDDQTHRVVGTTFRPRDKRIGNEELENWLARLLTPRIDFRIHELQYDGQPLVVFEIPPARDAPVRFRDTEWIRVGSYKKKLRDFPEKERRLWRLFEHESFESGVARSAVPGDQVLSVLDFTGCFDLLEIPLPTDQAGILRRLEDEQLIVSRRDGRFDITNLGAILFAKELKPFDRLWRKSLRIIKYHGAGRTEMEREWRDAPAQKGYAIAFEAAVAYINSQLPHNEPIGQAFRTEVRMYPERAIREVVANALIHQDFTVTGAGPMVEIFAERMEITNPGEPLVDTLRFIDFPPRTRNEGVAAMMRRAGICEEAGTGIDKAIEAIEMYQLPGPDFTRPPGNTRVMLFGHKQLADMDAAERIRACYQHCCLCRVLGQRMTNASLRERLGSEATASKASRIIAETVRAGMVRLYKPEARRKNACYVPFWA
jgi:predicted HTH transcriptional regulator